MRQIVITESERNQMLSKHSNQGTIDLSDVVITDWLSPDEKYVIFLDELYDIEKKTKIGNIWKSSDNLIMFLEHSFRVSKLRQDLKEEASNVFKKKILSESKEDLTPLKPFIKEFLLNEDFWNDTWVGQGLNYAGRFIKDTAKSTVKGVTDFGKDLLKGGIEVGKALLSGDWAEVLNLLKKGAKWLARKIRQAVYSPVGIIVDVILVATGVGKVPQVIVWAIVVCLDIYEFATGDYEHQEEPLWMRILFFLCDIMGLFTAGIAASAARSTVRAATSGLRSMEGVGQAALKNRSFGKFLKESISYLKELPSKLSQASSKLGKGYFANFFKSAINKAADFVKWILDTFKNAFKSPALKPALVNAGIITSLGATGEYLKDKKKEKDLDQKKSEERAKEQDRELEKVVSQQKVDFSEYL